MAMIDCGIYEIRLDADGRYCVREQLEGTENTFRDAADVGSFITDELERLETLEDGDDDSN